MTPTLSLRFIRFTFLLLVTSMVTLVSQAQKWTFRNGFGQSGATNGLADVGRAVCTDAAGNVYVTGKISDDLTGNTVSFGGTALVSAGDDDGFVAKFNSAGVHQWSIRFGGTSFTDIGYGIATDGTSVYVIGEANGAMTVGTSVTSYPAPGGGIDGAVIKLDAATGATVWVTRFGGGNTDEGQAICLDPSGNVYISGTFRTRVANPNATFGSFTRTVQGNVAGTYTSDLFVAQLNSSGVFQWVSTGGIAGGNDNINGSGLCYVPSLSEVVVVGSFRWAATGTTTATYSTTTPVSSVTLTNSGATVNEDFCLLEVAAATGAFVSGTSAGASDGNEAGLGVTYDSNTGNVFFAGSFSSASVTFAGQPANTNTSATHDNIMYGAYNPNTNAFVWVKDVDNGTPASAADVARAITANGSGGIIITGNFRNTVTFPGGQTLTASGTQADLFIARVNAATGNTDYITQGTGTSATADDIGYGIALSTNSNVWMTGQYASSLTLSPLAALASAGNKEDILLAEFIDPATFTTQPSPVTACAGLSVSFTVAAAGTGTLTYAWQEATNSTFTTGLITLSNTGVYSNTTTNTLTITDITGLNGRYYRAVVTNTGGSVNSNGALLTVTTPTLSGNNTVTQAVNTNNNLYYGAGCAIIDKVVPSGASPVAGSVTSQVWVEPSVPTYHLEPFVQRHYQITPASNPSTSTATVTLYFSQTEFDNFNAHAGSALDLPANSGDAAGKANLRVGRYAGSSSDGSGLPGSYAAVETVIDPVDANIVFNATFSRWEITFDVTTGFSGFVIQTNAGVLPVNLVLFTAALLNNDVQLKWETTSETQNDHFEVERSTNGRDFTTVGQRAAAGNNTIVNDYELTDAGAALQNTSRLYYRLKMVSTSGRAEYSRIVIIALDKKGSFVTSVLPNPFANDLSIGINAPYNGKMKLSIVDMAGRVLMNNYIPVTKGFSTQSISGAGKLAAGIYTLMVDFEGEITALKIVKE